MSLIISALQVRLYRLQLRVGNRWDGGAQTFTTFYLFQLCLQSRTTSHCSCACCLWLLIDCNIPFAIVGRRDSQTFTSCSSALQVCDRESLRSGCLLHVLWLSILCIQIISDRISCLGIAALPRSFTSSKNCFDGCEARRHCILSSTDYLTACCICTD